MTPHEKRPRRRWLQFSLHSLLLVMVFSAGYFTAVGNAFRQAIVEQRKAVQMHKAALQAERQARKQLEVYRRQAAAARADEEKAGADDPPAER